MWQEQSPSTKSPSRALLRFKDGKIQILIEVADPGMRTQEGGTVVVVMDQDLIAENEIKVGDKLVKPHVACRVYAKIGAGEVTRMRRRARIRQRSPVLFTSL
jgi:hypothetical protein